MSIQKILYENKKYNIPSIDKNTRHKIPTLVQTAYFENMVVMPKCKCHVNFAHIDIPSIMQAVSTTGYLALVRSHYRSNHLKRGCIAYVLDYSFDEETNTIKLYLEGIKRFISYQESDLIGYPHEVIKPDFHIYDHDDSTIPTPIDLDSIDPIFIQFFLQFIHSLNINGQIDFANLSLDKLLNSLIMIMPVSDSERLYLSEIPSTFKREKALALILNCTFNSLTSTYKFH